MNFEPDVANVCALSANELGRTVSVRHEWDTPVSIAPWILRGELVQVVHSLDRATESSSPCSTVVTVLIGAAREQITFAVDADDLVEVYPLADR